MNLWMMPSVVATGVYVALGAVVYLRRPPLPLWPVLFWCQVMGVLFCGGDLASSFLVTEPSWHFASLVLQYVGIIGLPTAWWLLSVRFAEWQGHAFQWSPAVWHRIPVGVAVVLWLGMLTTRWHGQFLTPHVGGRSEFHWMWWVQALWAYGLVMGTFGVLIRVRLRVTTASALRQSTLMMAGMGLTLVANVLYIFAARPLPFDPTITALGVSGFLLFYGIYSTGLFRLLPVALPEITRHDPDGVLLIEDRGTILYANPAAETLVGPACVEGQTNAFEVLAAFLSQGGEAGPDAGAAALAQALTGIPQDRAGHVYRFGASDDRWLRIEATPMPVLHAGGILYSLRLREITEFKRATDAVAGQAAALDGILGSAQEGLLVVDHAGAIVYHNTYFQDMWLLPPEVIAQGDRAALDFVQSQVADPAEFLGRVRELYANPGQVSHDEVRLRDGRIFDRISHPLEQNGDVVGRVWSFRDVTEARKAQLTLARNEEQYRAIFHGAQDAVFAFDEWGLVRSWNQAAEHVFGWTADEVVGRDFVELVVPPRLREQMRGNMAAFRAGTYSAPVDGTIEYRGYRRDGTEFASEVAISLISVQDTTRFLVFVRDITERMEAQQVLSSQRNLLRGVAESTKHLLTTSDHAAALTRSLGALGHAADVDAVYVMHFHPHPETGVLAASTVAGWNGPDPASERVAPVRNRVLAEYGWTAWYDALSRGEAIGGPIRDFPGVQAEMFEAQGVLSHLVVPIVVGDELWGVIGLDDCRRARVWSADEDAILRTVAAGLAGAIERDQHQQALAQSELRYRRLVEHAPLGVIACDRAGNVTAVNQHLVDLLGSPSIGATMELNLLTLPPLVEAGISAAIAQTIESGEGEIGEYAYTSVWGKTIQMRLHLAAFRDTDGLVTGVQAIVEDITERKDAEAALLHTQKLESLGILAGGIAHDFNNLLVAILGNASLARVEVPATSPAGAHLAAIEKAAERASDLTQQLLAYAGKGKFVIEPIDLTDVVEEMTHLLEVSIGKNVAVQYDLADPLPAVEGDAAQMRQIVMNLVINGSDAIGNAQGTVCVRTGVREVDADAATGAMHGQPLQPGRYVCLEVADTGCGMDADTIDKIFDPFFTTKFTGRGLGLAGVLGIVRGHKGALTVESEPGRGATFTVLLPVSALAPTAPQPPSDDRQAWNGTGTILVVDDDPGVLDVARMVLGRAGFTVLLAKDGVEAVEVVKQRNGEIDAVLLDLTMPRMSGEDTVRALRVIRPDLPIILSSGYSEDDAMQRFANDGLAGFVQKPYSAQTLLAIVRETLAASTF